jgi:hypothetical protein
MTTVKAEKLKELGQLIEKAQDTINELITDDDFKNLPKDVKRDVELVGLGLDEIFLYWDDIKPQED